MNPIFDITGNDIAQLNDGDLRRLIGLLSEAEFRKTGLSVSGIIWGGSQDAKDYGIDVSINAKTKIPEHGFIPRKVTGIQVKKPKMPKSAILKEMRPEGNLRQSIIEIGKAKGAYILVSSSESLSKEPMLETRLAAMEQAIQPELDSEDIVLDFYDGDRIASWARSFPSMIVWVKSKTGMSISGWRPYGNWAGTPKGFEDIYSPGNKRRFIDYTSSNQTKHTILEGIDLLRSKLSQPKSSVRLTGLSGVGKTRFAQALFDSKIGKDSLNPINAIYTDISYSPNPKPAALLNSLVEMRREAIVIIDNCRPELHKISSEIINRNGSAISLLTIEYDVAENQPEQTSVYRLVECEEVILRDIIIERYGNISHLDAHRIATFSGGNFRLAIALGSTLKNKESLSGLSDEILFNRLFWQENKKDDRLLRAAQACSLVYSFNGEDCSEDSEMKVLSKLSELSIQDLYRHVSVLEERGIVQRRSVWRAILPPAVADRLARQAIRRIPTSLIKEYLFIGRQRLALSLSKRLSNLHENEFAISIAEEWFSIQQFSDNWALESGRQNLTMMTYYSPVVPSIALEKIVCWAKTHPNFCDKEQIHSDTIVRLLCQLAYEKDKFEKSVGILIRFALTENPLDNANSIRNQLSTLFQPYLSGTHASLQQRLNVIKSLLESISQDQKEMGLLLLESSIGSGTITGQYYGGFGAHPRDYGMEFANHEEALNWYEAFLDIFVDAATKPSPIRNQARASFGRNLRSLAPIIGFNRLKWIIEQIVTQGFWNQGWKAIKDIVQYDEPKMSKSTLNQYTNLEKTLAPQGLIEKGKSALEQGFKGFGQTEESGRKLGVLDRVKVVGNEVRQLAINIANQKGVVDLVSIEFYKPNRSSYLRYFGAGLAQGTASLENMWSTLCRTLPSEDKEYINLEVIRGFIDESATFDESFYNKLLDNIIEKNHFLVQHLPSLQAFNSFREADLDRLFIVLDNNLSDMRSYLGLHRHVANRQFSEDRLIEFICELSTKVDGAYVAIDLISGLFYRLADENERPNQELVDATVKLLASHSFSWQQISTANLDFELSKITPVCLLPEYGYRDSDSICRNVLEAILKGNLYPNNYRYFLSELAKNQPFVFLDVFMDESVRNNRNVNRIFIDGHTRFVNPLWGLSEEDLLAWCEMKPEERYEVLIFNSSLFGKNEDGELDWKPFTYKVLERLKYKSSILEYLYDSLEPSSWSGSRAEILEKRLILLDKLASHENEIINKWTKTQIPKFQTKIENVRKWEKEMVEKEHESFE